MDAGSSIELGDFDYIAIQNQQYNSSGNSGITVETWIKTTDGTDQVIASFDRSDYWRLEVNGDGGGTGQIGWDIATNTGILDMGCTGRVDDGNWHHVAAVYDNGTASIYIDGVLDNSSFFGTTFGSGSTRLASSVQVRKPPVLMEPPDPIVILMVNWMNSEFGMLL